MSKTNQYKHGTFVYMATTHNELCPVAAVLSYLVHHPSGEGPLFQFSDGSPLTRAKFMPEFRKALSSAEVQQTDTLDTHFGLVQPRQRQQKGFQTT